MVDVPERPALFFLGRETGVGVLGGGRANCSPEGSYEKRIKAFKNKLSADSTSTEQYWLATNRFMIQNKGLRGYARCPSAHRVFSQDTAGKAIHGPEDLDSERRLLIQARRELTHYR